MAFFEYMHNKQTVNYKIVTKRSYEQAVKNAFKSLNKKLKEISVEINDLGENE